MRKKVSEFEGKEQEVEAAVEWLSDEGETHNVGGGNI